MSACRIRSRRVCSSVYVGKLGNWSSNGESTVGFLRESSTVGGQTKDSGFYFATKESPQTIELQVHKEH